MRRNVDASSVLAVLNDPKRLEVLAATALLDSPPEAAFDRLTRMASNMLGTPLATVAFLDGERQFYKSQVGLPDSLAGTCPPVEETVCQFVVSAAEPLVVADAMEHPFLQSIPAVRDMKVVAYLGVPLTTQEGQTIGSFCTVDAKVRTWTEREIEIMKDLATFIVTEIELRLLAKHFHENYLSLRNLEMEREELVQMLVHDLRNPLSSLLMGLDVLRIARTGDEVGTALDAAQLGAQSLLRMVNEILEVGQAEAGKLSLEWGDVCAEEVVKIACGMVEQMATKGGLAIKIDVRTKGRTFWGDKDKIRRVLVNLISNAVQHTPRGGQVFVSAHHDEEAKRIVLEVADNGMGIPKEAFSKIFEKYNQPKIQKLGKVSTGLGLPFCKLAVEAHGGQITLESKLGQGTTFRIEIPIYPGLKT